MPGRSFNKPTELFESATSSLANSVSIDSGWLDLDQYEAYGIAIFADTAGLVLTITSSEEVGGGGVSDLATPVTLGTSYLVQLPRRQRNIKVNVANSTGSAVTNVRVWVTGVYTGTGASVFPVGVQPADFSPAILTRSVTSGQQPDGDYVNTKQDGSAFTTTDTLQTNQLNGALTDSATTITVDSTTGFPTSGQFQIDEEIITYTGTTSTTFTGCTRGAEGTTAAAHDDNDKVHEVYISDWVDSDGWIVAELFMSSDTPSKKQGLKIQFTDDVQAGTPTIRGTRPFEYSTIDKTALTD